MDWKKLLKWILISYLVLLVVRNSLVILLGSGLISKGSWGFREMTHDCVGITIPPIIGWRDSFYGRGLEVRTRTVYCLGKDVWYGE